MTNFYISHGGPGSGRYPLGSGERPYQKFEGKGRKSSGGIRGYIRSRREKKAEEKAQKKAAGEERAKKEREENKEKVLRSGKASEILKYQGELTNQQMYDAAERLRLETRLSDLSANEKKQAIDTLKKIQSYSSVISSLAKDGIDIYNSIASVYNATDNGIKDPLRMIRRR